MKFTTTIILLLLLNTTFSQGYRGKRFSVSYQPGYSFLGYFSPEDLHGLIHNKLSVGFALSDQISVNGTISNTIRDSIQYRGYEAYNIQDFTLGINFLYFKKVLNAHTPIGKYIGLGFEYGEQNSSRTVDIPVPSSWGWGANAYRTEDYFDNFERVPLMIVSIYFGRNFLIKEKFLFGYGIQGGISLTQNNQPSRHFGKPFFNFGYIF